MSGVMVLGVLDETAVVVAIIGGVSAVLSAWFSYRASRGARHARRASERALSAIGPRDGETISALLWRIAEFEEYQHDRNHDILNVLQAISLRQDILHKAVTGKYPGQLPRVRGRRPPPGFDRLEGLDPDG